jgi:hypothetical protein
MVDGQTRRTLRKRGEPTDGVTVSIDRGGNLTPNESGTIEVSDRKPDSDDRDANKQSNGAERIGVVEVEPKRLGEFIANGGAGAGSDSADGGDSGTHKRRGRKPGTKNKSRKEAPQNVEALVTMVHTWAAVLLKTPELMLEETEVKSLSDAYSEFCQWHDVPILTPKRMSEINLIATGLLIYGTRFVAIKKRMKQAKQQRPNNVVSMPTVAQVSH